MLLESMIRQLEEEGCKYLGQTRDLCIYLCPSPVGPFVGVTRKLHPNSQCPESAGPDEVILPEPDDPNYPTPRPK